MVNSKILRITISNILQWNFDVSDVIKKANKCKNSFILLKRANDPAHDIICFCLTCIMLVLEKSAPLYEHALLAYLSKDLEPVQNGSLPVITPGPSIYPSIRLSVRPSIHPSVSLSICVFIHIDIYLSKYLSIYLSIYLYICPSVHLSILNSLRGPIYVINWVDNSKLPCYTLPPTQHHSFFSNLPPLIICLSVCLSLSIISIKRPAWVFVLCK